MNVSKNAYYKWLRSLKNKNTSTCLEFLKQRLQNIYKDSNQIYGSSRIQKILEREGLVYSRSYVAYLMRKMGIKSILSKKFRVTTADSNHSFPVAKNLLERDFISNDLGEKWVSDIT